MMREEVIRDRVMFQMVEVGLAEVESDFEDCGLPARSARSFVERILSAALHDKEVVRSDWDLHDVPVTEWTAAEAFSHLKATFDRAARLHPERMEHYQIRLADGEQDRASQISIMREALRDTFKARQERSLKPA